MNAAEFFKGVAERNYEEFENSPEDLKSLWNSVASMNTVAEYLALDQIGYTQVPRAVLDEQTKKIRDKHKSLSDLKFCADTLKHVRKIKDQRNAQFTTVATSTSVSYDDRTSWKIDGFDLVQVLQQAYITLNETPELT